MGRIERSWELVKASWSVLMSDKDLLVFPIVSTIAVITVTATFVVPMALAGVFERGAAVFGGAEIAVLPIAFGFYALHYIVIFYCNSALVGAATIRLKGGTPTVGDGFRIANERFASIVGYALLAATVGVILRNIARRGIIGRLVASIFGVAWNVATFLAVPVLVVEGVGPIDAVKRSTHLLKKTWGEQIAGNIGIGAIFALAVLAVFLLCGGVLALAIAAQSPVLILADAAVFIAALMALGLVGSTLSSIYTAAVYRYATEGDAGAMFPPTLVRDAFRPE
jgi:hypothetical protein